MQLMGGQSAVNIANLAGQVLSPTHVASPFTPCCSPPHTHHCSTLPSTSLLVAAPPLTHNLNTHMHVHTLRNIHIPVGQVVRGPDGQLYRVLQEVEGEGLSERDW
jgi:hypothetical protein